MANNILLPFEGLCAGVTGEKPLSTVDVLFVDLEVAAVCKCLQAGLTAIDDICFNSMVRAGKESSTGSVRNTQRLGEDMQTPQQNLNVLVSANPTASLD